MPDDTAIQSAISQLQQRYADRVTRRAWDELAALFEPGCPITLDLRNGQPKEFTGGVAIAAFIADAVERYDFFVFAILNSVVENSDEASGTATGRMFFCEHRHGITSGELSLAYGVYFDDYRRAEDGSWRFARRRLASLAREAGSAARSFDCFPVPEG